MNSVGKAAMFMVDEVRRQFRRDTGYHGRYRTTRLQQCVEISTKSALREMNVARSYRSDNTDSRWSYHGAEALGAYMAGVTVTGVLFAIFQNNAGGAWDNAKKFVSRKVGDQRTGLL